MTPELAADFIARSAKMIEMPRTQTLGPERNVRIYKLDIAQLRPGQRERLVEWICSKFHADRDAVELQLDSQGFPIREADVIVAFSMRAFV